MDKWILSVELDGEWEHCSFATPKEALSAFIAVAKDYEHHLKRAVLCSERLISPGPRDLREPLPQCLN